MFFAGPATASSFVLHPCLLTPQKGAPGNLRAAFVAWLPPRLIGRHPRPRLPPLGTFRPNLPLQVCMWADIPILCQVMVAFRFAALLDLCVYAPHLLCVGLILVIRLPFGQMRAPAPLETMPPPLEYVAHLPRPRLAPLPAHLPRREASLSLSLSLSLLPRYQAVFFPPVALLCKTRCHLELNLQQLTNSQEKRHMATSIPIQITAKPPKPPRSILSARLPTPPAAASPRRQT
jgi:hypothetical protein